MPTSQKTSGPVVRPEPPLAWSRSLTPTTKKVLNVAQKVGADRLLLRASKLPGLRDVINRLAWHGQSVAHCRDIYGRFLTRLERNGIDVAGADILEIGAGNSIGMGYFFAAHGIASWTASDPFVNFNTSAAASRREHDLARQIAAADHPALLDLLQLDNDQLHFKSTFRFIVLDATEFEPDFVERFDLIFSNSVLEHLPAAGLEQLATNCHHYLKPNGVMIHGIDLKDHINPLNPLGLYKYSESQWHSLSSGSIFYVNRWRHPDFVNLFQRHGFEIVECDPYLRFPLPKQIDAEIRRRYSDEELCYGEVFITARKQ